MSTGTFRSIAATGVLLMALAGCGHNDTPSAVTAQQQVVEYNADYPAYSDLPALFNKADLVIEATVNQGTKTQYLRSSTPPANDPQLNPNAGADKGQDATATPMVVTVFQADAHKVYKGDVKVGSTVAIKQLGGTLDGQTFREAGAKPLREGGRYILFLSVYPDVPASLLNPDQAQYPLDSAGKPARISDTAPTFTISDLEHLAQRGGLRPGHQF
ncbi:hypothetical protein [Dactylosporangium sp. NPDC051484]|uniref:hypothetical protein n=1 Tax=Dactylosporangium sp. NPDC051484 TaxID=3154942 RepID=UPI003450247B